MQRDAQVFTQSVLAPASDGARLISDLTLALVIGAVLVFVLVMALLVRGAHSRPSQVNVRRWLIGGGLLLPGAALAVLLSQGLRIGSMLSHGPHLKGMEIEVVAHRWWWEFRYREPDGEGHVVLANELHLPLDFAALLTFASNDVIHSFWVPALAGKVDVIPGYRNQLVIHAAQPGRYRGQCAEYCGTQHANMGMEVVVESPEQFRKWLLNQTAPAIEPVDELTRRGQQMFLASGCGTCHTIRGTAAHGLLGPDLTHMAGRRMLASATVPNNPASLAKWIRDAQHMKLGSLMPSMPLQGNDQDIRALLAYLGSLH